MSNMSTEQQGFLDEFKASLHAALKDDYTPDSAKKIAYRNAATAYPVVFRQFSETVKKASENGTAMINSARVASINPGIGEIFNEIRHAMQLVSYDSRANQRRFIAPRKNAKPKPVRVMPPEVQTVPVVVTESPAPDTIPTLVESDIMAYSHDTIRLNLISWAMTAEYKDIVAVLQLTREK
jgi:hypothetical protein